MDIIQKFKKYISGVDWILLGAISGLVFIGLASIFSTGYPDLNDFYRQITWYFLGLLALFVLANVDYRALRVHFSPVLLLYGVGVLGLLAVHFFGTEIRGAKSWLEIGPFHIETVELLKIVLVLILAKYFSTRHVEIYRFKYIAISGLYVLIPAVLILLQPDVGSVAVVFLIWAGIILISGIRTKHLALLGIIALLAIFLSWNFFLADYQKERVTAFLEPAADPYGAAYNSIQSKIAVASGGIWGEGISEGLQTQFGFLPETHTDFIYAAIAEEMGAFAALSVLILYGIIFWRLWCITERTPDNFGKLSIMGISVIIITHIIINVAMTLGLLPITGLPLPFVSYGGSSLVTIFAAFGIIQNIHRQNSALKEKEVEIESLH